MSIFDSRARTIIMTSQEIYGTVSRINSLSAFDHDDLIGLIQEADAVEALSFFGITVKYIYPPNLTPTELSHAHPTKAILSIPNNFDPIIASQVVSTYLTIIDDIDPPTDTPPVIIIQARSYDKHTESRRGADDGTYDYAGSYPLTLFDMIHITLNHNS